jgi:hypothetical protein
LCKVKNWEEVRIKGIFVYAKDSETENIEECLSKWYY